MSKKFFVIFTSIKCPIMLRKVYDKIDFSETDAEKAQ
jgi:hypothetical protein